MRWMLRYAILTLLADDALSGYDLSKAFEASLTHLWPARQSQIYPELHRLEREGLVEATTVEQSSKPDKRLYRLSKPGQQALSEWIVTPQGPIPIRDAFQLRAFNFGRMELGSALALLTQQKTHLARRITMLEQITAALEAGGHTPGEPMNIHVGWRLVLEAGLRVHRAYYEWCDWTAAQLTASAAAAHGKPSGSSSRSRAKSPRQRRSSAGAPEPRRRPRRG
jgi:DNA-binding PadR family transcriptional regulator